MAVISPKTFQGVIVLGAIGLIQPWEILGDQKVPQGSRITVFYQNHCEL